MCQSTSGACNINDIATFLFRRHVRITTRSKSVHLFVNVEFDFVEIFVLITPLFFSRCRITSKRFWTNGTRSTTKSGPSSSSWNETDAWPKPMPAPFPSKSTAAMTDSTDFGTDFTLMPHASSCYMVTHWAQCTGCNPRQRKRLGSAPQGRNSPSAQEALETTDPVLERMNWNGICNCWTG